MSTAALGGVSSATSNSSRSGIGGMSSDEFLKIMMAELNNQDPFEPNDSAAIIEQLSGLQNIEAQASLQESLETLVSQNTFASSTALIGKIVTGVSQTGDVVTGTVSSVNTTENGTIFTLDTGAKIDSSRLQGIEAASTIDPTIVPSLLLDLVALNGTSLVGQKVSGVDAEKNEFTGTVESVSIENGSIMLNVDLGDGEPKQYPASYVTKYG